MREPPAVQAEAVQAEGDAACPPGAAELMFRAIAAGDPKAVRKLLRANVRLAGARNARGVSALRVAAHRGQLEILSTLVAAEPYVDVYDAAACGASSLVTELLGDEPGLSTEYSPDGFTALHVACYFGHADTVGVLLTAGADPNAVSLNHLALFPLNSAVAGHRLPVLHLLLDRGADIEARMAGGFTALHAAAHLRDIGMTDALLLRGADPQAKADDGRTAIDIAAGHEGITALLAG